MRQLFILLLCCAFTAAVSQNNKPIITAGSEMQKARNYFYGSFTCTTIGVSLLFIGTPEVIKSGNNPKGIYIASGALLTTSLILNVASWVHIGNAGEILDKKHVRLNISPVAASLCYKF